MQKQDMKRYRDCKEYRRTAIRELFEETGILLARDQVTGHYLSLSNEEREKGRSALRAGAVKFQPWIHLMGGMNAWPDIGEHLSVIFLGSQSAAQGTGVDLFTFLANQNVCRESSSIHKLDNASVWSSASLLHSILLVFSIFSWLKKGQHRNCRFFRAPSPTSILRILFLGPFL